VAPIDVDGDGDLDLAVLSLQGLRLALNRHPARHFVRLRLRGAARGARIEVEAGGRTQVDWLDPTAGFHTQQNAERHFGLGAAERVTRVTVRWASGTTDTYEDLQADARYTLTEGGTAQRSELKRWPEASRPRPPVAFDTRIRSARLRGGEAPLAKRGRPAVVNFWAPWCDACKRELPALRAFARAHPGVDVVGVSVETDLAKARAFAKTQRLDFDLRVANDDVIAAFFGPNARIELPATFVFDAKGQLQRSFYREIDGGELTRLAAALEGQVSLEDFRMLALSHIGRGEHRQAGAVLDEARRALEGSNAQARIGTLYLHIGRNAMGLHLLRGATKERPDDVDAWAALGWALRETGDLDAAEGAIRHALARAPTHAHAQNHLGRVLEARGDLAGAARWYRGAVAADPDFAAAKRNLKRVGG